MDQLLDGECHEATSTKTEAFKLGDIVEKVRGSEWVGTVCGTYSTDLTPEGYCVESLAHAGSVQIYPATALKLLMPGILEETK